MEELLKQIIDKLNTLDDKITNIESGQTRIEKKLDVIYDHTADLTEFRASTNGYLSEISKDVGFIKHKLHQNEEEIFDIKTYIKLAK
ncbi:hypothetical protein [Serpentinicella alkaliphila]|uniref:Uncharacterized protein n=1 Tax=Serpentinicella alkaliphila TaxID=1734049 RepID=A0A4R2SWI6_9FIRM|nr:hypothetical protein [Serpentinicella alkaliphila]QUH26142.1 hypothetical protein HZR23_10605 [Serpentinicella alkaliphila]TCP93241.1 hypothetical protein EDD79_10862 [Serpentinicella alkaliphila]